MKTKVSWAVFFPEYEVSSNFNHILRTINIKINEILKLKNPIENVWLYARGKAMYERRALFGLTDKINFLKTNGNPSKKRISKHFSAIAAGNIVLNTIRSICAIQFGTGKLLNW